jgi:hypothetical protein
MKPNNLMSKLTGTVEKIAKKTLALNVSFSKDCPK